MNRSHVPWDALCAVLVGLCITLSSIPAAAEDVCRVDKEASTGNVIPVRVSCVTDLTTDRIAAVVRDPLRLAEAVSSLGQRTRVLEDRGGILRVLQFHESRLIADREVVVDWRVQKEGNTHVVTWTPSKDQTGRSGDNIPPAVHEGRWEVSPHAEGSEVVYYVKYLPGGNVPDRMVRSFVAKGVSKVVDELLAFVRREKTPSTK